VFLRIDAIADLGPTPARGQTENRRHPGTRGQYAPASGPSVPIGPLGCVNREHLPAQGTGLGGTRSPTRRHSIADPAAPIADPAARWRGWTTSPPRGILRVMPSHGIGAG
jgi:hypothetical protein